MEKVKNFKKFRKMFKSIVTNEKPIKVIKKIIKTFLIS